MKIVINSCFGGFSLSKEACEFLGVKWDKRFGHGRWLGSRTDERLIQCIETLGERANGTSAHLTIVEIPDDVEWEIEEYDGRECVAEKHRVWC